VLPQVLFPWVYNLSDMGNSTSELASMFQVCTVLSWRDEVAIQERFLEALRTETSTNFPLPKSVDGIRLPKWRFLLWFPDVTHFSWYNGSSHSYNKL